MAAKGYGLESVYDVRALRVIVSSKADCYEALRQARARRRGPPSPARPPACSGAARALSGGADAAVARPSACSGALCGGCSQKTVC